MIDWLAVIMAAVSALGGWFIGLMMGFADGYERGKKDRRYER